MPDTSLRIATYNIQKCVGMDLRRQPRRTLQVISALGAEVVLLQEADKRLPPRPAALPHFVLEEAGWEVADLGGAGSLGWHGNAIVWRPDAARLVDKGYIHLPGLEPRGAVWVALETTIGAVRFVGAHLGLTGRARRAQVHHLMQETEKMGDMPVVWGGDFNEWSRKGALTHLAPDMRFLPPKASFPSLRPLGALDRIAHSAGLRVSGHGVFAEQPAHIASDHLPVWADLQRQ